MRKFFLKKYQHPFRLCQIQIFIYCYIIIVDNPAVVADWSMLKTNKVALSNFVE